MGGSFSIPRKNKSEVFYDKPTRGYLTTPNVSDLLASVSHKDLHLSEAGSSPTSRLTLTLRKDRYGNQDRRLGLRV